MIVPLPLQGKFSTIQSYCPYWQWVFSDVLPNTKLPSPSQLESKHTKPKQTFRIWRYNMYQTPQSIITQLKIKRSTVRNQAQTTQCIWGISQISIWVAGHIVLSCKSDNLNDLTNLTGMCHNVFYLERIESLYFGDVSTGKKNIIVDSTRRILRKRKRY